MNWLTRSLFRERRGAKRHTKPPLETYYWCGAVAAPHRLRDISSTGAYLLTEERWRPGTILIVTLQTTNPATDAAVPRCITVQSKVVRWGIDGVAFMFVFPATIEFTGWDAYVHGVDRRTFGAFMGWKSGNATALLSRYARLPLLKLRKRD